MANTILIKRSGTANAVPTSGQLANGEIAINYADGNLFYKDTGGTVQLLVSNKFVSVTGNITTAGNISGNYFIGNGSQLTGVTAVSSYGNANVVANLAALGSNPVSTTGNITGGNLNAAGMSLSSNVVSALNVTGAIAGANITTPGLISAAGNITGGNILGGANVNATTHTGTTVSVTGNITGGNLSGTSIVGTLTTAAQTNITSVGTLGSLAVTANIAGGNITTGGQVSATGNITGGNILGGANVNATTHTGTTVSVTGNITGGNILGGANVNATTHTGTTVSVTGNITGGNVLGGANVNATTHTGTTVSVSGNVTAANLIINGTAAAGFGVLTVSGNIQTTVANNTANIGNVANYFNTVHAKATTAQYADLAEWYSADANYPPGTVLSFGGNKEVTMSTGINDARVAGIVSTQPAHVMNAGLTGQNTVAVALIGRVPALVVGAVVRGDMMVTAGGGRAMSCATPTMGTVIGKALQNHPGGQGTIEIVVGRL